VLSFDSNQWKKDTFVYCFFFNAAYCGFTMCRTDRYQTALLKNAGPLFSESAGTSFVQYAIFTYNNLLYNRIVFYIIFYCTFILFMVLFRTNSVFYACVFGIFVGLLLYHYYFAHFSPACFYYPPEKSKSLFIVIRLKFVYCTFLSILFLCATQHIII